MAKHRPFSYLFKVLNGTKENDHKIVRVNNKLQSDVLLEPRILSNHN